jgi:hypothetical protein
MLSDERETLQEALERLEAERTRRSEYKGAPFVGHELADGRLARVLTGVPRTSAESEWYSQNSSGPTAPGVPDVSGAEELVPLQHGIAASQIFSLPSGPTQAPTDWTVNFRAPNGPSGRVTVEVDPGDGKRDCGEVAEGDWSVHGDELILKMGKEPATAHPLMGRSPTVVARKALHEQVNKSAFHRRLRYPTTGIV